MTSGILTYNIPDMFNTNESENKMVKQQFDIGTYFTIQYYAKKHNKTVTRRAQFTNECEYGTHKVYGFPYFKYFDVDANGIRCASKSWKISEVRT